MSVLAQGGTGSPPAGGGGDRGDLRDDRRDRADRCDVRRARPPLRAPALLRPLGAHSERTGLPAGRRFRSACWAARCSIAVFGMYWDISTHLDAGRDAGPFANASHYFILAGLFGSSSPACWRSSCPDQRPGAAALRLPGGLQAPLGGLLILVCSAFALIGVPARRHVAPDLRPGRDAVGPDAPAAVRRRLAVHAGRADPAGRGRAARREVAPEPQRPRLSAALQVLLGGALPDRPVDLPGRVRLRRAAVPARLPPDPADAAASASRWSRRASASGRGGALGAVAVLPRGARHADLLVSPLFGHTMLHFPLYLVEALVVERWRCATRATRPIALGLLAGAGIGTVGPGRRVGVVARLVDDLVAVELLPEGAICGFVVAVAGGVIGGFIGRALSSPEIAPRPVPRFALPGGAGRAGGGAGVRDADPERRSGPRAGDARPTSRRRRSARSTSTRHARPARCRRRRLLVRRHRLAGQGGPIGGRPSSSEVSPGVYRTTEPLPVYGNWKTTLRLHKGSAVQGLAVYFPEDKAIPVKAVPGRAAVHARVPARQEAAPARAEAGVPGCAVAARLRHGAADRPRRSTARWAGAWRCCSRG